MREQSATVYFFRADSVLHRRLSELITEQGGEGLDSVGPRAGVTRGAWSCSSSNPHLEGSGAAPDSARHPTQRSVRAHLVVHVGAEGQSIRPLSPAGVGSHHIRVLLVPAPDQLSVTFLILFQQRHTETTTLPHRSGRAFGGLFCHLLFISNSSTCELTLTARWVRVEQLLQKRILN